MSKKILFLTTMYPGPLRKSTIVCHSFVKEWQNMGYDVIVVHFRSIFPKILYWGSQLFKKLAVRYIGNDNVETDADKGTHVYRYDGALVYSIGIFKCIPHAPYSKRVINNKYNEVIKILENNDFQPDYIIGHFYNPQLPIIHRLKQKFTKAKTALILHEPNVSVVESIPNYKTYLKSIDVVGGRSESIRQDIMTKLNVDNTFVCHSGIPDRYLQPDNNIDFSHIHRFCFVGQLLPNKQPVTIIKALVNAYPDRDFDLTIIGKGPELKTIQESCRTLSIEDKVHCLGYMSRDDVQQYLAKSQVFVMVSLQEAFGLVYLEAMGKGCISIGTRNQGIDGVIKDGYNGFLAQGGDIEDLTRIFKHIRNMSVSEIETISSNAKRTALNFSDNKVAQTYIDIVSKSNQ